MTEQAWLDRLFKVECPDSTYRSAYPVVFSKAKGSEIISANGQRYLDLCAGFGVHALGHNPDDFRSVWEEMLSDGPPVVHAMGDVYPSKAKVELLEALVGLMPDHLTKAGLAISGGQAVEFALKTAMLSTNKTGIIAFREGYHGLDFGSLAVTERPAFRDPFKAWLPEKTAFVDYASTPETLQEQFAAAVESLNGDVAAVIMEPIQGRGGVIDPGEDWRTQVAQLTKQSGALLILDEIFVGLGRTGRISFAGPLKADLTCLGKPLGGGLPLSACVGTEAVMNAWPENHAEALHTGTFFGHALACRLGTIFLQRLSAPGFLKNVRDNSEAWQTSLTEALASSEVALRGDGFMIGLDYGKPGAAVSVMHRLVQDGVIALPAGPNGSVLSLTPPLVIPDEQLTLATKRISQASLLD